MLRFLVLILLICSSVYSCTVKNDAVQDSSNEEKPTLKTISFEGIYSIGVPKNMKVTSSLSDYADIQYSDIFRGQSMVVEHFDKEEYGRDLNGLEAHDGQASQLSNIALVRYRKLTNKITVTKETEFITCSINGLNALVKAVDGKRFGMPEPVCYWFACIEGEKLFYSIEIRCPEKGKVWFESEANRVIQSFQETKK